MRKSILYTLLMFGLSASAQITITQSNMPKSGETFEYSNALPTTSVDVDKTGANVEWDFSHLTSSFDGEDEFLASFKTPYVINFGFSALGKKLRDTVGFSSFQFKNIYSFYRSSSSTFSDVGIGFQFSTVPIPQAGKHSDPDEIYVFPLKFGNRDSTTFDLEVPISIGIAKIGDYRSRGHRITTVDGWGKITTPHVKNENCIRLKSVIKGTDSIKVSTPAIDLGVPTERIEYKWLSTSEKIPVLTITGNVVAGNFVVSSIQYRNDWSKVTPTVADFSASSTSVKKGDVVTLTNLSTGQDLTYGWTISPGTFIFVNGTTNSSEHPKVVFQDTGWYSVSLTATNSSGSETETKSNYIHVSTNLSVSGVAETPGLNIYPNPAHDNLVIDWADNTTEYKAQLFDLTGRLWSAGNYRGQATLNLTGAPAGAYSVVITTPTSVITKPILIQ